MFIRVGLFYVLTWFCLMLLGGFQQATGLLPPEIGLAQWGPGLAALLMLLIFRRDGFKINFITKDTPVRRYLFAFLIPLGMGLVVLLITRLASIEKSAVPAIYDNLGLVLLWMPLGALGEEIGWRGYLHKKLDIGMRGLFSSLLTGLLWMPIHIHFFAEGPIYLFFFAVLLISYSIVIYALVQDSGFNVLLAAVFHLGINLSNLLFLDVVYETAFMMVSAGVWAIGAALLVLWRKDAYFIKKA